VASRHATLRIINNNAMHDLAHAGCACGMRCFHAGGRLDARSQVLGILDDVLNLKGRARDWGDGAPLLGAVPELDSMAVASVLTALEERLGIVIDDDEIDGSTFATVGSLVGFVQGKLGA
jgi:acyl carrier protein